MSDNQHFSKHSTGPRTDAGKAVSSRNAVKHHLTCSQFRMTPGESQAEFDALQATLIHEHQPATITESLMIELMTKYYWLIQRAIRTGSREGCTENELSLMCRYQASHDRSFHNALKTLRSLQAERKAEERGEADLKVRALATRQALQEQKLEAQRAKAAASTRSKPVAPPNPAAPAKTAPTTTTVTASEPASTADTAPPAVDAA